MVAMRACAFPPCPRPGVETMRLAVDGTESVLLVCPPHADWLRSYAAEDPDVHIAIDAIDADERDAVAADQG